MSSRSSLGMDGLSQFGSVMPQKDRAFIFWNIFLLKTYVGMEIFEGEM